MYIKLFEEFFNENLEILNEGITKNLIPILQQIQSGVLNKDYDTIGLALRMCISQKLMPKLFDYYTKANIKTVSLRSNIIEEYNDVDLKRFKKDADYQEVVIKSLTASLLNVYSNPQNDIKFSKNGLTSIPPDLLAYPNTFSIDLSNNKITSLPNNFYMSFERLNTLNLSNNLFTKIDDEIFELYSLNYLNVSNNKIFNLPNTLNKIKRLENLLAMNCKLTSLPQELKECKNLKKIMLEGNKIPQSVIDEFKTDMPQTTFYF